MATWILVLLPILAPLAAAAAAAEASPEAVVERVLAADDASAAGLVLGRDFGWNPGQVDAVLALSLAELAALDRAGLALLLAAHAGVGEPRPIDLAAKRLSAGGGMVLPGGAPGHERGRLTGGARFELEQVVVAAQDIDFGLAPLPDGGLFLGDATLEGGAGDRVRIDTRESRFPGLAFRGLLAPRRMEVTRLPVDQEGPLAYAVELEDLGDFTGRIRDREGRWLPVAGSGERMRLGLSASLIDGRPTDPRIGEIRILGGADGRARLDLHQPQQVLRLRSSELVLRFGDDGALLEVVTGTDTEAEGVPHVLEDVPPAGEPEPDVAG